ncbi:DUF397 domain-containing protein [Kitasatospora sp. NBC_01266]|uniref:DUF397 domain-containing protein n=1 Tax=Kitasatospora sp. NBC_01266 TaxID=2903572 RepID=UPI002E326BD4|nr:DUF397 domain-containing protein [Kitasatospora sp. NBC_01266]
MNHVAWRKSTFSGNQGNCVEVADGFPGAVPVRDSKDPHGPALVFRANAWQAFVTSVQTAALPIDLTDLSGGLTS